MIGTRTPQRRVTIIPAQSDGSDNRTENKPVKLRVAAYCRVSTDDKEQLNSYVAQKDYYSHLIEANPEWELAGIFADEGITGTSMKKRDEFNRMLAACKRGRINLILTKSVSRFARNTVDCIKTVRMLKEHGIGVRFEKENIDTSKETNEFILTLFSSFAQSESESISKNVTWGMQKSMRSGKVIFQYNKMLGYKKGADGEPEVVPEEAETVRMMYTDYASGMSIPQIKDKLESKGILTKNGSTEWTRERIHNILTNEKYIGDALLQKTYTPDCLTKKVRKNNGERPQYYVTDHHEAIIDRELWHRVQEEMSRRSAKRKVTQKAAKTENGKYSGKYALSERLICGECGSHYRRCTWVRNGNKRIVWRCISRLEYGTQYCKESPTIDEYKIHEAIVRALNNAIRNRDAIEEGLRKSLETAVIGSAAATDTADMRARLDELETEQSKLISAAAESGEMDSEFLEKCKAVNDEITKIKSELMTAEQNAINGGTVNSRLQAAYEAMDTMPKALAEYDDRLVARIVRRVTINQDGTISVELMSGESVSELI